MSQFISADILELFGLDWRSMLFYIVNFLLLLGALIGLLYLPIKKMLKKKRDDIENVYGENEKLKAECAEQKAEYERMIEQQRLESARTSAKLAQDAQKRADRIIGDAKSRADEIIASAKREAAMQSEQLKGEYRSSVNKLAVEVAQKLLEREISADDNDKLIEQVLSDWEDAD